MAAKNREKQPATEIEIASRRQPQASVNVKGAKQPVEGAKVDYYHLKACWRIKRLQIVEPYGFHVVSGEEIGNLRGRLSSFETMTWNEIFLLGKKQNHSIPVPELGCPRARKWMRENLPDQPELWTIRIGGAERIWGIFSEGAYQVIFWDPKHLIYPTNR